jgi:hypothetical protein
MMLTKAVWRTIRSCALLCYFYLHIRRSLSAEPCLGHSEIQSAGYVRLTISQTVWRTWACLQCQER